MKNFFKILIALIICVIVGLWSPWMYLQIDLPGLFGVEKPNIISGLQVFSLGGEMKIYVDNEEKATVNPENSPVYIDSLTPGEKLVTLKRVASENAEYWSFNRVIRFEQNKDVILSYILGPSQAFSEGHVISLSPANLVTKNNLKVVTNVESPVIEIDGIVLSSNSNEFETIVSLDKQHEIKVYKEGYDDITFKLMPDSQEERDKFEGFIINVDVNLLLQPVDVQ